MFLFRKKPAQTQATLTPFTESASFMGRRSVSQLAVSGGTEVRTRERVLYCIVLPTKPGGPFKKQEDVDEYRQDLVNRITNAGLSCTLFYSVQEDEIFVKVHASDQRLLQEADLIDFTLALDESAMRTVAMSSADMPARKPIYLEPPYDPNGKFLYHSFVGAAGEAMGVASAWHDMNPSDIPKHMPSAMNPFLHLHAKYDEDWEKHHLNKNKVQVYKTYSDGSILRTGDRMKLVQIILERGMQEDTYHHNRGAGLNLGKMVAKKHALACFPFTPAAAVPLHEKTVDDLYRQWSSWFKLPWSQPLDDIRDVFGEKVALYFAFLGHYTMWLFFASIAGIAVFFHQLAELSKHGRTFFTSTDIVGGEIVAYTEVPEAAVFALFMALWATFLLEFWKRQQARLALRWGVSSFEAEEVERPEFLPSHVLPDPVTGKAVNYYSPRAFQFKVIVGFGVIFTAIMVVVATIAAIFILKVWASQPARTGMNQAEGTYMALAINAIAIQILGVLYKTIARGLNDWENHKTDTQYEDALIVKTFLFCFCNSYATLFYMAYIKSGTSILGELQACEERAIDNSTNTFIVEDLCFGQLGVSLLIIFILQIVVNNTLEVVIPTIMGIIAKRTNLKIAKPKDGVAKEVKMRSPAEDQYFLKQYDGTFDDFLELALQFGYVTLFVAAFPLAPFLAFVNNVLEIRVDSYKICKLCRRPEYKGAQDIGSWQYIFYVMGFIAVLSNAGVVFFASRIILPPPGVTISKDAFKVWMWVISVGCCLVFKWLVDFFLNDVPTEVKVQLARQDYLVRKCLVLEPDDDDEIADEDARRASQKAAKQINFEVLKVDPYVELVIKTLAQLIMSDSSFDPEQAFKSADKNKNGKVNKVEFARLLKSVGGIAGKITTTELEMIADALDSNGNGELDYAEFIAFVKQGGKA